MSLYNNVHCHQTVTGYTLTMSLYSYNACTVSSYSDSVATQSQYIYMYTVSLYNVHCHYRCSYTHINKICYIVYTV